MQDHGVASSLGMSPTRIRQPDSNRLDSRVVDLLALWEEARERGRTPTPEELCRDHPNLLDAVRAGLSLLRGFDARPTLAEPDRTPPSPRAHPRYRFDAFLARGGMGEVWRGTDTLLGRAVALKILGRLPLGDDGVARFRDEARLAGGLQHPGIVPVHDLGELPDGQPFFVMKLVEGRTLTDLLRDRPDPRHDRDRWLRVFGRVCQAVAFAHSRGVLHRDLKPSNVMVGGFGEVQVLDWGIAKLLEGSGESGEPTGRRITHEGPTTVESTARGALSTRTGHVKGTPAYMAPEQARGQNRQVSPRSDVFGLGGILCVILTGEPPYFAKEGAEVLGMAEKADLSEAFARLDRCAADPQLVALTKRCLAADPADRPRDAAEVLQGLEQWRQLHRFRSSLPPAGPLTQAFQTAPYLSTLVFALLPHALGACLVTVYVLMWAAANPGWEEAVGVLTWLMLAYSAVALLGTGVASTLLTAPMFRTLDRLKAGGPVTAAEAAEARRQALKLHGWALLLCGFGWLPGGVLVPCLLGALVGQPDGTLVLHFVMAFLIAGLTAMTYCTLATDFLVLRVAYPRLWLDLKDLATTVPRELRRVPARLHLLPLLAVLVPLVAAVAFMVNLTIADSASVGSSAGRLFQALVMVLVVLGMVGSVVASLIAHFLRRVVGGLSAFPAGGDHRVEGLGG